MVLSLLRRPRPTDPSVVARHAWLTRRGTCWQQGGGRTAKDLKAFLWGDTLPDALDRGIEVLYDNLHPMIWLLDPQPTVLNNALDAMMRESQQTRMEPMVVMALAGIDPDWLESWIERLVGTTLFLVPDPARPGLIDRFLSQRPLSVGQVGIASTRAQRNPILLLPSPTLANDCQTACRFTTGTVWCWAQTRNQAQAVDLAASRPVRPVFPLGGTDPWPQGRYGWPDRPGWVVGAVGNWAKHQHVLEALVCLTPTP